MAAREGGVDRRDLLCGQRQVAGPGVFLDMLRGGCLGDREKRGAPHQEGQGHLAGRRVARFGDLGQDPPPVVCAPGKRLCANGV